MAGLRRFAASRASRHLFRLEREAKQKPELLGRLIYGYAVEFGRKGLGKDFDELSKGHLERFLEVSKAKEVEELLDRLLDLRLRELYVTIAELAVHLARCAESLSDFDVKGVLQERAPLCHYETALQLLKLVEPARAREVFQEAVQLRHRDQQVIGWREIYQVPSVYVPQLRPVTPWWDPLTLPLAQRLLQHVGLLQEELRQLLSRGGHLVATKAYPRLTAAGDWDVIRLYNDKRWDPAAAALAPETQRLIGELPGQGLPYIHHNTEEAGKKELGRRCSKVV